MRAVDTNVLVRLITRDDAAQVKAAEAFVDRGAWVSHLVLAETVWVLEAVYGVKGDRLATAIEMLIHHRDLTLEEERVVATALERFRQKPRVGFSDCLALEIARQAGHLPFGTFDRDLGKLDGVQKL